MNPDFWTNERSLLYKILFPLILQIAEEGINSARRKAANLGLYIDFELIHSSAMQWAAQYTDLLLNLLGTTSEKFASEILSRWIKTPGMTMGQLVEMLTPRFSGNKTRADLVAVTEVTRAYAEGEALVYESLGIGRPAFIPPGHPGCRCWTALLVKDGKPYVVWMTERDHKVCKTPISTPWGIKKGCQELHGMALTGEDAGLKKLLKGEAEGHPFRGNQYVEGQSEGISRKIESWADELRQKYGLQTEVIVTDTPESFDPEWHSGMDAEYLPDEDRVIISEKSLKRFGWDSGGIPSGEIQSTAFLGLRYLVAHEMGHALDRKLGSPSLESTWSDLTKEYRETHEFDIFEESWANPDSVISKYSTVALGYSSHFESFAEAFSVYECQREWLEEKLPKMHDYFSKLPLSKSAHSWMEEKKEVLDQEGLHWINR